MSVLLKIFAFHIVPIRLVVWWQVLWSLWIVAYSLIIVLFFYFTYFAKLELFIYSLKLRFTLTLATNSLPLKINIFFIFWINCRILREFILFLITQHKPTYDTKINFLFLILLIGTLYIFMGTPIIIFEFLTLQIIFNINSLLLLTQKLYLSFYISLILIIILFFILFLAFSIELNIINLHRK